MRKKLKIVRVDWLDAQGGVRTGWREVTALEKEKPVKAISIGVLLKKDKNRIVVCPHLVGDHNEINFDEEVHGDGVLSIPNGWVTKITVLGIV